MQLPIVWRPRSQALLFFLLVSTSFIALLACKAEVNISVDEEDMGEIEIVAAVNDVIISFARLSGEDPFEYYLETPVEELETEGLRGAIVEPYSESGYTGIRIRADFYPNDPILTAISDGASVLGEITDTIGLDDFKFIRTEQDDGWIVHLNQSADPSMMKDFGDFVDDDVLLDIGALDLPFIFTIELPGEYVEHNADRKVNGVLIWNANLLEGINISVVSRDPRFQFEVAPIIITALFILIFGGIVAGVIVSKERRRKREKEDRMMETQSSQIGSDSSI